MTRRKKCGKQRTFKSRRIAEAQMRRVPPAPDGTVPTRAYWCAEHGGWHYTRNVR